MNPLDWTPWTWVAVGALGWVLFLAFMCLAARWNKGNDEAAQRLADRHYRDNDNPEGEGT